MTAASFAGKLKTCSTAYMKILLLIVLIAVSAHAADPVTEFKYDPNSPVALAYKAKQESYERDGQALPTYELNKELGRLDSAKKLRLSLAKPEELLSAIFTTTDDDSRALVYASVLKKRGETNDPTASFYYAIREWGICLRLQQEPGEGYKKMTEECWAGALTALKRASNAQIASASFNIARVYENGFGVTRSKFVAAEWYVKSADQYNKQNSRDEALTALESALNLVPDHPSALRLRKVMLK